jgi:DNA polymerase-3 subunit alpha
LSFWTAWLKVHYPVEALTGILHTLSSDSSNDKDRIPEYVTETRRLGITVLPPDVSAHASGFRPEGTSVRYGLDAIKGIGARTAAMIGKGAPYGSYEDFARRSGSDKGVLWLLAKAGALDGLVPSRRGLVMTLDADRSGLSATCVHKDEDASGPNGLPCTYDWDSEPVPVRIGKRGQELKSAPKAPPRKCTRACRNYSPPDLAGMEGYAPYTPGQLWAIENEIFGTWLTPLPFERLGPELRETARDAALALPALPPGIYPVLGVVDTLDEARTKKGGTMHWLRLATEVSLVSVAIFRPRTPDDPDFYPLVRRFPPGTLVSAELEKTRYQAGGAWRTSWQMHSVIAVGD